VENTRIVIRYNKILTTAAISLVIILLIMIASPFGNPTLTQVALAQVQPDNTYIPSSGFLAMPPEMVAIP
jgi:amino acid transporter